MPRTVAVVIATYNRSDYVRTCLQHVMAQSRRPDELVVVDASRDDLTRQVVRETPGVEYLRNERGPGGTATSRAIGVTATSSEIVAFLDDDSYPQPDWLDELLQRYTDPSVAAVGGRARNGREGEEREGLGEVGLLLPNGTLTGFFAADTGRDVDVDHLLGANMSVRRRVVDELGGIHDYYPGTCLREETDIALRIRRAGYRIIYTPTAVVDHVAGPYARGRRFDTRYKYYGVRNHVVLLARTLGATDPHLTRFAITQMSEIARDLKASGQAIRDPQRPTPAAKLHGMGGALLRAGAKSAGLVAGAAAATRLRVTEGPVAAAAVPTAHGTTA